MSDATKRTCGCDWSLWETCDECNPDDEAAEIRRLRTRLAESEAEVGNQRRLRMLAEEAIPKGTEVARDYFAAEAEALLNRARAETDLVRQGLDLERTARLAAEAEAEKWRSEARRALAAEAERDDLLGALRGLEVSVQAMLAERDQALADYQSLGAEVLKLTAARDRALACEAAARGLLKSLAETILNIEGDRTSRGHEARSEAVIRACVRALSSPPSPTSAPDQEPGEGGPCLWCGKSYTAKAVDIAWDSGKHLVGVAECPACQYPALVKMDAPEVERGKCGECRCDRCGHQESVHNEYGCTTPACICGVSR